MLQRLRRTSLAAMLVCFIACACLSRAYAQSSVDGAIGGTVMDNSGSVVPNAAVVVQNNGTNAQQTATTDGSGYFRIIHLQPGTYSVSVTAGGFNAYKSTDLTVQVGLLTDLEARLTIGSSTQTIEVTGEAPVINTTSADFAGVIPTTVLRDLPVSNYRWSSYSLLTPGVVNDSNGYGLLSFRGASTLLNNVNIDGTDDNQAYFSEERGRTRAGYSFSKAAVQEFQVNTSNYSVEYGRSAGGIVNSVTRSGSNSFHGEGYYYDRDSAWAATNASVTKPFLTPAGTYQVLPFKPTDLRRQYGFGVGGPILKDRLFFFFAADKFYHDFPGTATITGTTANANFFNPADPTLPAGKTCSSSGLSYQDQQVCAISKITSLSYSGAGNSAYSVYTQGISNLTSMLGTVPRTGDQTLYFPRLDWQVNSRNHVSVEANRMRWTSPAGIQTSPAVAYGIRSFGNDYVRDNWIVGKLDTFLTSSLSNEARYMYGRDFEYEFAQSPTTYEQNNLINTPSGYVNPLGLPVNVFLSGFFQFGTPQFLQRPSYPDERRWQIADTVEWIRGNHDFKFGGDYIHTYDLVQNLYNQYGGYSYTGATPIGNYLGDLYLSQNAATAPGALHYSGGFGQAFGSPGFDFTTGDYSGFAQDQWKFSPRLSLTGGIRYEYEQFPSPIVPNAAIPQTTHMPDNKSNIGPRVGFAYDVYGAGKTVLRGGYGMFFARAINSTIYQALSATGAPAGQVSVSFTTTTPGAPTFPQVLTSTSNIAGAGGNAYYFDPNFKLPLIHQADLTLEQDMGWDSVFSLSWLGSWGRRLPDFVDTNLPAPTAVNFIVNDPGQLGPLGNGSTFTTNAFFRETTKNFRPNPAYGSITDIFSGVTSNYEAFVAQFKHRMSHHVELNANYTWSHALDFGQNNTTGASATSLLDPTNIRLDYGNSNQNVPNRLVVYGVGDSWWHANGWLGYLVNDFEISPSYAMQTGLTYSANINGASSTLYDTSGTTQSIISTSSFNGSGGANRVPVINRNNFQQPRTNVLDLRLSKRIKFEDKYALEFLGEAFNIANHPNVTAVNATAYNVTLDNVNHLNTLTPYSVPFSQTTSTNNSNFAYNVRQLQLAVRFQF
ncbi:TonB-dependent receptor [Alloacidobacterium sp.]|uniref:TonB-dependent receptor n=1 Tax=Alloacidobacterium sp. TaxID=2951999 RepID=UPI002D4FD30B|nr:TonB-dependent receptor [Alloacidobacterium sp.]HYK35610.1 TonB-dependent receptor [Alloacidobacterium sp.]